MNIFDTALDMLQPFWPMVTVLVLGVIILTALRVFLDRQFRDHADRNMKVQLVILVLSFLLLILVIVVAPIRESQRGQILSLIGIVASAAIALSSTTFLGNAMAGIMLRAIKGFRIGEFVSIGEHFGRVTERGLFHVEVQTEESDLISLPNLYLVTNPVKTIRSSGTIIWCEVSLGYDVPRTRIKEVMLRAAELCELTDPFVHVKNLGDFSVTYRAAGVLKDVKQLLSTRSRLREQLLDEFHAAGIEIVSPTFMNQRQYKPDDRFIPEPVRTARDDQGEPKAEEIAFEKADEAESTEQLRQRIKEMEEKIKQLKDEAKGETNASKRLALEQRVAGFEKSRKALEVRLQAALNGENANNGK